MISTLYLNAAVSIRDEDLMYHLTQLADPPEGSSATMYRLGIANDAGELYRLVIVFGLDERSAVMEMLRKQGYRRHGPHPERRLDAIFLPPRG